MEEIWKDVTLEGFGEYYQVSSFGRVKRKEWYRRTPTGQSFLVSENILNPYYNKKKYLIVNLMVRSQKMRKTYSVHRLVALAFIPNKDNKPQVNHIDCNKSNNNVSNLEWCNNSENQMHALKNGLKRTCENNPKSKLTNEQALDIRKNCVRGKKGFSMKDFSNKYNVSTSAIAQILDDKTYKYM